MKRDRDSDISKCSFFKLSNYACQDTKKTLKICQTLKIYETIKICENIFFFWETTRTRSYLLRSLVLARGRLESEPGGLLAGEDSELRAVQLNQ